MIRTLGGGRGMLAAIGLLFLISTSVRAQDRFGQLRARLNQIVNAQSIPSVAVAIVEGGEITFAGAFGMADRERGIRATADTPYPVMSASKVMTATGLMKLAAQGQVDLDRPANDYLGASKLRTTGGEPSEATVRQVANHSSGLMKYVYIAYESDGRGDVTVDDLIARHGVTAWSPGERFEYSNLGFGVLERIIERVSGTSYSDFLQAEVFAPLGMTHTSVGPMAELAGETAAQYSQDRQERLDDYAVQPAGSGEVYASARDLARFAIFQMKQPLEGAGPSLPLDADSIDAMQAPSHRLGPIHAYGLAWHIIGPEERPLIIEHGGSGAGAKALFELFPQHDLAVVILINSDLEDREPIRKLVIDTVRPGLLDEISAALLEADPPIESVPGEDFTPLLSQGERVWAGTIDTPEGSIQLLVQFDESGFVFVSVGRMPMAVLHEQSRTETRIRGVALAPRIGPFASLPEAFSFTFDLRLEGDALKGLAVAEALSGEHFAISHWVELRRIQ